MRHDPRVTRVGRLIRRYRVDEVPQFINVLKGEMAIVGPRPHEPEEVSKYPIEFSHISKARAGITGVSQVSGASSLKWIDELTLDNFYVNNRSLKLDVKIVMKTIGIFFSDPTGV
jgi:lipopolysaccharide/colanic/teichoic acid biosynthesis glycosyltransferase